MKKLKELMNDNQIRVGDVVKTRFERHISTGTLDITGVVINIESIGITVMTASGPRYVSESRYVLEHLQVSQ